MISIETAWAHIDACAMARPAETVALDDALGRTLARAVFADADQPAFDRSSIDGFAVATGQPARETWRLAGEILPGQPPLPRPGPGEALRVCTGSALPPDVALVMVEDAMVEGDSLRLSAEPNPGLVRQQGSSIRAGVELLAEGTVLGPGEIALLASVGVARPEVVRRVRVVHLVTGSEIIPFQNTPQPGQIRDTNGPLIRALLGAPFVEMGPTLYADESIASARACLEGRPFDLLLISGGASVGPHDNTPALLASLGFETVFHRVNIKPGKPLLFARSGDRLAFGIPGNPVSHFACTHLFIRRALDRLARRPVGSLLPATLGEGAPLRPDARTCFWPARLSHEATGRVQIEPLRWVDSGDLAALGGLHALLHLPGGEPPPAVGDPVRYWPVG